MKKLAALPVAVLLVSAPHLAEGSGGASGADGLRFAGGAFACGDARGAGGGAPEMTGIVTMLSRGGLSLGASDEDVRGGTPLQQPSTRDLLFSALLPGLGELRTGHRRMAAVHFAAEAAVWVSLIAFRVQGELRKDDYVEYAQVFAGVRNGAGRSDDYYRNLARYIRSDPGPNSYNEREVRETARALYPDDPEARRDYIDENEIRGELAWNWESQEHWSAFRELRESGELSFQRSRFCIGAAVANRIASVLGLARNRRPGGSAIDVGVTPVGEGGRFAASVSLRKNF